MQYSKMDFYVALFKGSLIALFRKIIGRDKFKRKTYNGQTILDINDANRMIKNKIIDGDPFVVARFGDTELRTMLYGIERKIKKNRPYPDYIKKALSKNAGFFPIINDGSIDKYVELMIDSCKDIDVLAVWFNLMEDYMYKQFGPSNGQYIHLKALEPFWSDEPWTSALKGKKVLIIHPFARTIEKQYKHREQLFTNKMILPEFNIQTLEAVQSIGGKCDKFKTWFDALEWMYSEAMKKQFDIAIIGCGAYGLPLAIKLKKSGKIAIHMGGVTQMLFGIKGHRWDLKPEYAALYNNHWCRPSESEKPIVASEIEDGCYW